jgi:GT2 family glycosyltransferase
LKLTEPGVALGFVKARADLVMVLAADNIFPDPGALQTMLHVFNNPTVAAAFPKHDTGPGDNLYSRYINTFTDPVTHFVYGDGANARTFHRLYKTITHTPVYDIYDYRTSQTYPIIALAQGFTVRKQLMPVRHETSDDVLTVYRLIDAHKRIAYVHSVTLYHYTIRDTKQFIAKQRRAVENALLRSDSGLTKRNTFFTTSQRIRMYLFVPYALTIVPALIQSIAGFIATGEVMWLTHWYFCLFSSICIVITAVPLLVKKIL